jgi:hypothetical protein
MAVEKQMIPSEVDMEDTEEVQIEVVNPDAVVSMNGESMIIDFTGEMTEQLMGPEHDANLAEFMEEGDLEGLASELVDDFIADRQSRKDWARSYVKGLDLLGMKIEERTQPWAGRSRRVSPGPYGSCCKVPSAGYGGVVSCFRSGKNQDCRKAGSDKQEQAQRVETEMNYLLTEEMTEYRDETEQMLFRLPLAGSLSRKFIMILSWSALLPCSFQQRTL